MIKTFSGKLIHGGEDKIHLSGGSSDTAFRIVKLQLIGPTPGIDNGENVVKIYSDKQTTSTGTIDFTDDTLLAAAYYQAESTSYSNWDTIIFDKTPFNQDIFIGNFDARGNATEMNYYLELEEFKINNSEAAVINYRGALLHGE